MKRFLCPVLTILLLQPASVLAQAVASVAAKPIQESQTHIATASDAIKQAGKSSQAYEPELIVIPKGTSMDVEAAHTVNSRDLQVGELISFRVLIPVTIKGAVVIEKGGLVTARIVEAKRAGHWGRPGRFAWSMEDVIAADATRVPVEPEAKAIRDEPNKLESLGKRTTRAINPNSVKGTGHGGEVATKAIIAGALFPPLAPLGLMQGFRRGENAVLPQGKRFVVFVRGNATVTVTPGR